MTRAVRLSLAGSLALIALAGCGRGLFQYAEREPWRREAELACLNSGAVREGISVVRIEPIDGPGICGADFPLRVTALGESPALGFADEVIRPPASIPGAVSPAQVPRWPIIRSPYGVSASAVPVTSAPLGPPISIQAPNVRSPRRMEDDAIVPTLPHVQSGAVPAAPEQPAEPLPQLGPPSTIAAKLLVSLSPPATLACPIVSALDQWIATAIQPAALRWFNQPVVEIKQISAYSCRGMNGQPGARISEHAFGNALDVAAFVLADGRRVTVKDGWRGTPDEQGFLRDIQGAACDQFTTVLAPGSNDFHYDHIHVDLMRRTNGRRICQPGAVDGALIAARARANPQWAARHPEPPPVRRYDPPYSVRNDPFAWRGDTRRDPQITGSIAVRLQAASASGEDNDWVEDPGPRPSIDWRTDHHRPH